VEISLIVSTFLLRVLRVLRVLNLFNNLIEITKKMRVMSLGLRASLTRWPFFTNCSDLDENDENPENPGKIHS
jgi:hypothetical protein